MNKYHYEYFVYTHNLCYGRLFIAQCKTLLEARKEKWYQEYDPHGKGCCVIEKHRVYE